MKDTGKMCNEITNKKKCYISISRFQEKEQYQTFTNDKNVNSTRRLSNLICT